MAYNDLSSLARETLPISHVYMPTNFHQVIERYLNDNPDENECVVLGQWEVKSGKPGRSSKRVGDGMMGLSPEGVVTRRQMGSFIKPTNYEDRSPLESTSFGETEKRSDIRRVVIVVNIVGMVSVKNYRASGGFGELQVIGTVRRAKASLRGLGMMEFEEERDSCPMLVHFQCSDVQSATDLTIDTVSWRGQDFYPGPNRIIMFYYDPEEFQRWKIPDSYPLGVPQVVLNGLAYIQNGEHNQPHFVPAFPQVPLDHQDLLACSQIESSSFIATNPVLKFISSRSSGLQQIIHKVSIVMGTLLRAYPVLPVLNFLFLLLVDSLVGYLVTRYLLQLPNIMGFLHTTVDQMLSKLNHLLKWLRGAPAGLKLNPNLNSLYWRFFSYHIHLWANYIGILEPIFAVILYTIQYFGVLGATIQISLLKDLLSLATFHVYCLYIYATRLYSLQTTAIKALCRVFFGRKYNPLRNRIDSVQLTTPELFLSSFGFVILIFLFPTTMVYYAGFVFLRVPVLLIERLLQYLVITYNKLPIISWLLVYLNSPRVADEIYLVPVQRRTSANEPYSAKNNNFLAFRICLQSTRTLFVSPNVSGGIKNIVSCTIDGTVLKD